MKDIMMKRWAILFFVVLACSGIGNTVLAADFQVGAEHAIVVEADSGRVLYEKDAKTPDAIASLTKLVTVYLVLDKVKSGQLHLSDQVNLSDYALELTTDSSLSNVAFDEKSYSVQDLLTATLVASSNSAAIALAEQVAGSEPNFVTQMRDQLSRWGIDSAKIFNASGLPNEVLKDHRYPGSALEEENALSAQDVAVVVLHLLEDFPEVLDITKQAEVAFAGTILKSFNRLLPGMANGRTGVDGLKTGTTEMAGHCLAVTSIENGMRVITVILNADGSDQNQDTRFEQANRLLDYVDRTYHRRKILKKGRLVSQRLLPVQDGQAKELPVFVAEDVTVILGRGERVPKPEQFRISDFSLLAPIAKGEVVAYLTSPRIAGQAVRYVKKPEYIPLKASQSLKKASDLQLWWRGLLEKIH
ncbi:D-alanyl-D-alanine carboxypeptidase PBP3 [Streptococcus canis]